jgi:hypothetical protein
MKTVNTMIAPTQLISIEKAKELNQNFIATRSELNKNALGKDDANALWYSLKTLENYIAYIKTEGSEQGYEVDGIRFYFGVYSDSEIGDKAGHTTLFLSPTGKQANMLPEMVASHGNSRDITTLKPMNFGTMGNPPKMEYAKAQE